MNKKYKLGESKAIGGRTMYRVIALRDIPKHNVIEGETGGWIEKEENLSQDGNAWIADNAMVFGSARIYDGAYVCNDTKIFGWAEIYGHARVYERAHVFSGAKAYDYVEVYGSARVTGNSRIYEHAKVYGNAQMCDNSKAYGYAQISGNALLRESAHAYNDVEVFGLAAIGSDSRIASNDDYIVVGPVTINGITTVITATANSMCHDKVIDLDSELYKQTMNLIQFWRMDKIHK